MQSRQLMSPINTSTNPARFDGCAASLSLISLNLTGVSWHNKAARIGGVQRCAARLDNNNFCLENTLNCSFQYKLLRYKIRVSSKENSWQIKEQRHICSHLIFLKFINSMAVGYYNIIRIMTIVLLKFHIICMNMCCIIHTWHSKMNTTSQNIKQCVFVYTI